MYRRPAAESDRMIHFDRSVVLHCPRGIVSTKERAWFGDVSASAVCSKSSCPTGTSCGPTGCGGSTRCSRPATRSAKKRRFHLPIRTGALAQPALDVEIRGPFGEAQNGPRPGRQSGTAAAPTREALQGGAFVSNQHNVAGQRRGVPHYISLVQSVSSSVRFECFA